MIWKRTLPCVLLACLSGSTGTVLLVWTLAVPFPPSTQQWVEGIIGTCFFLWLLLTAVTAWFAKLDMDIYFLSVREAEDQLRRRSGL